MPWNARILAAEKRVASILAATVLVTATAALCANNPYHLKDASVTLKMAQCLECHSGHSGTGGKTVDVCVKECLYRQTHSVMGVYPPPARREEYAPQSDIERAGCILEDGKITCLSCHDLSKPPPHLIRQGDDLCRICHLGA